MQFATHRCVLLIELISGHLSNGRWRFKVVDGVTILTHIQAFNRHGEFRIGPNQVLSYEIEQKLDKKIKVKVNLTDNRYFRAYMSPKDISSLDSMVNSCQEAPVFVRQGEVWLNTLIAFLAACIVLEFFS